MTQLCVDVRFDSDWTIGTGHGIRGAIDVVVARDPHGLPVVPASYFLSLWRDACETIAAGFDAGDPDGEWNAAVKRLFGTAGGVDGSGERGQSLLSASPGRLVWHDYLIGTNSEASMARRQLIITRSSTQLDDERGVAEPDTQRVREAVRAGTRVQVPVTLLGWDSNIPWPVRLLLAAGLLHMEHLSGKRRRGAGRCRAVCPDWDLANLLDEHAGDVPDKGAWAPEALTDIRWPTTDRIDPPDMTHGSDVAETREWRRRATITLRATMPVVVAERVIGNTTESLDYIPGGHLLAIVASAAGGGVGDWIRDARMVVTPAHPGAEGWTGRAPMNWMSPDKGRAWRQDPAAVLDAFGADPPASFRPVKGWEHDGTMCDITLTASGHGRHDDEAQKPLEQDFFVLEEIAEGSVLTAEIWGSSQMRDAPILRNSRSACWRGSRGRW